MVFLLLNAAAMIHAYKFTHFTDGREDKTRIERLSLPDKLIMAFTGVSNPKPKNNRIPAGRYEVVKLKSNVMLEAWYRQAEQAKGTVILFHGYTGEKSGMIDKSDEFLKMGYNTLLVDFMGAGNSQGNAVTIGYREAENVKTCFDYIKNTGEQNICLFGTSMGAVAILKAISNGDVQPNSVILECPYGSMVETVEARFKMVHIPAFPMAYLLVFWGGIENGFWGFSFNPGEYAKDVKCPALLLYGAKDDRVSMQETERIFKNLGGYKQLKVYKNAGHENYLVKYKNEWVQNVSGFLKEH